MEVKMFEIRDRETCIAAMAIRLEPHSDHEQFLLSKAGYGRTAEDALLYILLMDIYGGDGKFTCDPYKWTGSRTMFIAHLHIYKHWETLQSGGVIDGEYLKGETKEPKESEMR